jgi:hypothetical protein
MDVNRRQCTGFWGLCVGSDRARRRLRAVLCILAFTVQLVVPVVHMWEVAAQHSAVTFAVLALPFSSGQAPCSTALSVTSEGPQRLLHDAAICPVCQALTRMRAWLIARVEIARSLRATSWLVFCPILPPAKFSHAVMAARAPPSTSSDA